MHIGCTLANKDYFDIPESWLLLDTCSTCDVIKNPDFVTEIRECKPCERLIAYCNGGEQKYNLVAKLVMVPISVHFKRNSMANIISMKTITNIEGARVTMDTSSNLNIVVTLADGETFIFKPCINGLYYFDTNMAKNSDKSKNTVTNYFLTQTVEENKKYFTVQEIKGADTSRDIQQYLHYPSTSILKQYVNENLINNCKITADDINRAEIVYGPAVPYIQGHMTRKRPLIHNKVEKSPYHP